MPMAIVVPRAVAKVEVAVRLALLTAFSADAGQEHWAFGVVTGPEALGIEIVDQAIVIVVGTIATSGDSTITLDEEALRDATVSVWNRDTTVREGADGTYAGTRRRHGTIDEGDAPIIDQRITAGVVVTARSDCKR